MLHKVQFYFGEANIYASPLKSCETDYTDNLSTGMKLKT